jgi:hypothetical protein
MKTNDLIREVASLEDGNLEVVIYIDTNFFPDYHKILAATTYKILMKGT